MVSWRSLARGTVLTARGPVLTAPGPAGGDMLRSFGQIRRDPMRFLERTWREHGGIAQYPIPMPPTYLVSTPEGARRVLVTNARAYGKRTLQYSALSLVTGEGLLTADTEVWRERRRILQPAFHHAAISMVATHVENAVGAIVEAWRPLDGHVVDVDEAMMHGTLEVVGHALFGTDLSGGAERIARATLSALDVVVARARTPIAPPAWVPTPNNLKLRRAMGELDDAVRLILASRADGIPEVPRDMLDLLLVAHGARMAGEGEGDSHSGPPATLNPAAIRDEIVTFIVAGHETVGSALTWAWHLLSQDQLAMQRLVDEARSIRGPLDVEAFTRLPYARAVLDEALRLYPPAWLITRNAREADVLDGVTIPAGALIIISPWILHRDPASWPDPERFMPDRFMNGDYDRHAYIPFGAGPRLCIGRDMALLEGTLMLAGLVRRVDVESVGAVVRANPLVTIRPVGGLPLRIHLRS
jgi:cytochrome P450